MARRMQSAVMKGSRLKIPLIFAADVIHGHRTIFPVPVAEAASFEPSLAERTARVAAYEAAAAGIDWTFFPMVDIARDQRWGRTMEGAGEDVLVGNLFAAARVRGFQGPGPDGERCDDGLRQAFRRLWRGGVGAGLQRGRPVRADAARRLSAALQGRLRCGPVLRDEWKFPGIIVSDYTGDEEMIAAGFAKDGRDAARIAFLAGVDMCMQSNLYMQHLPGLVRDGLVPQEVLDRSVRRVLVVKHRLGLFDDPFRRIDVKREKARSRTKASLALAREAGRKSIVLLKNDGDLLPLPKAGRRLALIGPFASGQHDLNGPWVVYGDNKQAVDLATGLRAAMADPSLLSVTAGSGVEEALPGGIDAAVAAATAADIVLLAIGESESMSGEAQSRTEIVVPAPQQALAEAVAATGKPVVVILKNGTWPGAARRGARRARDPDDLVPGLGKRPCHRRRAVRRLFPLGAPADQPAL
ncbi:hypothetical protein SASPL_156382 [Salvia splendens]|uniref:beta-glucosidase n=1 Tax=Salvia splendens TaxID=180675 RepID=A0A8X8VX47_SALSN|nr:hypothetical protein SASPL_156382 [Salvia splendens]